MTAQLDVFAVAEKRMRAAHEDSTSAVPVLTRLHIKKIALRIIETGQPFTFVEADCPHRCVLRECAQSDREIAERHAGYAGSLPTSFSKIIKAVGRAKRKNDSRRHVHIWIKR